jgi:hypothetical protein
MLPSPKVTSPARHSMPCNYPETLQSHSIIFPLRLLAIRPPPPSNLSSLNQPSPFPANRHHHPILSSSTTPNRFEASSASSNSRPLLANTVPGASGAVSRRPSALGFRSHSCLRLQAFGRRWFWIDLRIATGEVNRDVLPIPLNVEGGQDERECVDCLARQSPGSEGENL